ncbi:MAG TPA: hypothetical protein VFW66_08575 [Gemmatimonadales bacterium]|nr:hypothetical protein [Gemmatimonadales bacterium]
MPRQWAQVAALMAAAALSMACTDAPSSPAAAPLITPSASRSGARPTEPSHYTITDLGTLGGSFSIAYDINDAGRVSGAATVPGELQHAVYWADGKITDVGTLGGPNSEAAGRSERAELAILSDTRERDPLEENFCGLGTGLVCGAAVWSHGTLTALPTLGGINAAAFMDNTAGMIVGVAEDGTRDATCIPPQKSHFQAVAWYRGTIHELPPLPSDEVGIALRLNDRGQAVGTSGLCSNTTYGGFALGPHAVLWDHGTPINVGDLGGGGVAVAADVNNRGEVVGSASVSAGGLHPFLWTRATGIRDLGVMSSDPADVANTPFEINDRGQMVGASCDATLAVCRGYLWEHGVMTDINDLLPADSPLYVMLPFALNDRGQIAGLALVTSTGEVHAFLATPAPDASAGQIAHASRRAKGRVHLPEHVREMLGRRFQKRFQTHGR